MKFLQRMREPRQVEGMPPSQLRTLKGYCCAITKLLQGDEVNGSSNPHTTLHSDFPSFE